MKSLDSRARVRRRICGKTIEHVRVPRAAGDRCGRVARPIRRSCTNITKGTEKTRWFVIVDIPVTKHGDLTVVVPTVSIAWRSIRPHTDYLPESAGVLPGKIFLQITNRGKRENRFDFHSGEIRIACAPGEGGVIGRRNRFRCVSNARKLSRLDVLYWTEPGVALARWFALWRFIMRAIENDVFRVYRHLPFFFLPKRERDFIRIYCRRTSCTWRHRVGQKIFE